MSTAAAESRTALVEELMERFPHIPREAVLKEDLLRTGMAFDDSALSDNLDGEVKPKSYFIFSFDQKPLAELGEAAHAAPAGGDRAHRRPLRAAPHDRLGAREPRLAVPGGADEDGVLGSTLDGRAIADVGAAADARVLPAHAREREDRDGDRARRSSGAT